MNPCDTTQNKKKIGFLYLHCQPNSIKLQALLHTLIHTEQLKHVTPQLIQGPSHSHTGARATLAHNERVHAIKKAQ